MDHTKLEEACNYLYEYTMTSLNFKASALTPKFVIKTISPLYELVPRPKPLRGLFRVTTGTPKNSNVGSTLLFKPKLTKVVSWTTYDKAVYWKRIAEDVGYFDDVCVIGCQEPLPVLTTPTWVQQVQKVINQLRKKDPHNSYYQGISEINPKWQNECIAEPRHSKVKVVAYYKEA